MGSQFNDFKKECTKCHARKHITKFKWYYRMHNFCIDCHKFENPINPVYVKEFKDTNVNVHANKQT